MGAHPTRKGLLLPLGRDKTFLPHRTFFSTPLSFPGLTDEAGNEEHAARRSTGGTSGNGRAAANSEAGTSIVKSPDRSRSTARSRKSRARAYTRRERACTATDQPPLPGSGKGAREGHGRRKDNQGPDASTRTPRTTARSARGSALGPDSRTPHLPHTTGIGGEERRGARWQNERSGRHSQ